MASNLFDKLTDIRRRIDDLEHAGWLLPEDAGLPRALECAQVRWGSLASRMLHMHTLHNGCTVSVEGETVCSGFAVTHEEWSFECGSLDEVTIIDFLHSHAPAWDHREFVPGTWTHRGRHMIGVTLVLQDREAAREIGRFWNQLAIYDLANGETDWL